MKDLIETTDPITEITVVVKDVAEETDVTVTARKEEADRDSREATVRRMVDVTAVEDRAQEVVQAVR